MPTTTQAQINALLTGYKPTAERDFTDLHRRAQAGPHLEGLHRGYQPVDDEGERLPAQVQHPQLVVEDLFPEITTILGRLFDLQLTQDQTNCVARADLVVDGTVLLSDVPATHLLWLDKKLVDLRTFIRKLPVLADAEQWTVNQDTAYGWYESAPVDTVRTQKVPKAFVKWEPPSPGFTQPAQVDTYTEDVRMGTWTTVKLSGAVPRARVRELDERVGKLIDAVKVAREVANSTTALDGKGSTVLKWLFR